MVTYAAYLVCLALSHSVFIYDLQRSDSMEREVKNSPRKITDR